VHVVWRSTISCGRGTSGLLSSAAWNLFFRSSTSSSPFISGVTMTLQPLATAKLCESGSRAAIHIGGVALNGFGTLVEVGNLYTSPSWA